MNNLKKAAINNGHLRGLRVYPHGFFKVNSRWTVECWNREAERLLFFPAISMVGENLWKKFSAVIPGDFYNLYHKLSIKSIPVYIQLNWAEMGGRFDVVTFYFNDTLSVYFSFRYAC